MGEHLGESPAAPPSVVVLTTSHREEDIIRAYDLGANSYIIKPVELQPFIQVIQALETYWFWMVVLPPIQG